jgi:hypothetical protein
MDKWMGYLGFDGTNGTNGTDGTRVGESATGCFIHRILLIAAGPFLTSLTLERPSFGIVGFGVSVGM